MKNNGLIVIVAIAALVFGMWAKNQLSQQNLTGPTPLPEFNLPDLDGKLHRGSEWSKQIKVINFWASWCPPCRKEIPDLNALHKQYASQGLVVIGIAIDDPEAVRDFLAQIPVAYPILMAADNGVELARQFGNYVDAVPFTVVADRHGQIIYRHPGNLDQAQLTRVIAPLISR